MKKNEARATRATRATRAKETENKVNNRAAAAAEKPVEAVEVESVEVEAVGVEAVEVGSVPAAVPAEKETPKNEKVTSKDVLKAAGTLRAAVREERRGANCTIRLIAARAANGDAAAVDVLCALCDVPRAALFSLNIDTIRAAVNAYYPYFIEAEGRKISVKPVGVWYSTPAAGESSVDAATRVKRGYVAAPVFDYLDQLIKAAKCRAKGVTPRRVDAEAIYSDTALSKTAVGITATEIDEAKARRAYLPGAANVWKKDRNGFYI